MSGHLELGTSQRKRIHALQLRATSGEIPLAGGSRGGAGPHLARGEGASAGLPLLLIKPPGPHRPPHDSPLIRESMNG